MKYAIETKHVSKIFFRKMPFWRRHTGVPAALTAVDNLNLAIKPGEFVGFLGPNGAGKSTTIKMLTGILHPTSGHVLIQGISPQKQRVEVARRIGVVFGQRTQLWWDLPLRDSFAILQALYRVPRALFSERLEELRTMLELDAFWATPVRQLSLGQRMRGDLAGALLHGPEVLFLDEPTIGLDVTAKLAVRSFLLELNKRRGTTVILTTHDMSDVEELCSRIVVIDHGRAVFDGSHGALAGRVGLPSSLIARYRQRDDQPLSALLSSVDGASEYWAVQDKGDEVTVSFDRQRYSPVDVLAVLQQAGTLEDFVMTDPRLEDVIDQLYANVKSARQESER